MGSDNCHLESILLVVNQTSVADIQNGTAVMWSANAAFGSADAPGDHYINSSCNIIIFIPVSGACKELWQGDCNEALPRESQPFVLLAPELLLSVVHEDGIEVGHGATELLTAFKRT